jgi:ribosome-binding factor A
MGHGRRRGPDKGFAREEARPQRARIKDAQLCAEVREVLSLALDERFSSLSVIDVVPAPDATRLCVVIETDGDLDEAREQLDRSMGWMRSEVASAIHRKKAPGLTFDVRPRGGSLV